MKLDNDKSRFKECKIKRVKDKNITYRISYATYENIIHIYEDYHGYGNSKYREKYYL